MKIVLIVAASCAALSMVVAAIVILSYKGSNSSATITIDAPAHEVFPWLTEPNKVGLWIGGFVKSEPITEGGTRVGARSRETFRQGSKVFSMETEVVELKPSERLVVKITMRDPWDFDATAEYTLTESGDRTTLKLVQETYMNTALLKLFSPVINAQGRKKLEEDLQTLKAAVESM